jgi:hypothetical protein
VLMEDPDGTDIADEEHRQDDARGLARAKQEREDQHLHQAHACEPGLRDADAEGGNDRKQPLCRRERRQQDC